MEKKERYYNYYCELPPEGEEMASSTSTSPSPSPAKRESSRKGKDIRILRRTKTMKERSDPERFSGDGVNFRAKMIGTENVFDARGNRMCQGALQRLKAAVKSSGDHKQKIILNISLEGIIIKEEKSGDPLHHHPIHKISFISQDTKDSRAFGYVYGCPQTGHQFFAIKTEKAASQVVVTLRDLFLVALQMKKSEIERNNTEQVAEDVGELTPVKNEHQNGISNGNVEIPSTPVLENGGQSISNQHKLLYSNTVLLPSEEPVCLERRDSVGGANHSLLDLQSEVDNLQQGISHMDHSIATSLSKNMGISFSEDDVSEASSTSIANAFHFKLDKLASLYQETLSLSSRSSSTSDYNAGTTDGKLEESDTPKKEPLASTAQTPLPPEACSSGISSLSIESNSTVSEEAQESTVEDRYAVFLDIDSMPSIFDDPSIVKVPSEKIDLSASDFNGSNEKIELSEENELESSVIKSSTPVAFAELDPLGNQPYVDKRDFFQDIKNPPKKILKDLVGGSCDFFSDSRSDSQESLTVDDSKLKVLENVFTLQEISSVLPPKLPPKRSAATITSEFQPNSKDPFAWEPKNPFNPFLSEEYPDVPPPSSPPPPPPPRLPTKVSETSPTLSPPPPRPPSRVSDIPTPPLPKRKVPLNSVNRTWFSFDQDVTLFPPTPFTSEVVDPSANHAPPLPSPARKLPPPKIVESPLLKTSSASNSPSTVRRLYNKSPRLGSSAITSDIKDVNVSSGTNVSKKILTRHSSVLHENDAFLNCVSEIRDSKAIQSPRSVLSRHSSIVQETDPFSMPLFQTKDVLLEETVENSPPLPPKPVSISRSRPSPLKRVISGSSCSSSSVSVIESSNGTRHSSSSLVFSSLDENKMGSSSEALFTNSNDSNSDVVFAHGSKEETVRSASVDILSLKKTGTNSKDSKSYVVFKLESNEAAIQQPVDVDILPDVKQTVAANNISESTEEITQLQSSNNSMEVCPVDVSPDSIFRRKSDPFADDFFLSLHKKTNCESLLIVSNSNGVEKHFDNIKAPT